MPATPFEYAWRPLQRLKVSLISVSFTAKVQGSKMWQITGKWLLGNNHSNSRAGQSRVSAANAVRRTQVYGKQLSDYGHKSIKRLKDLYIALVERSCREREREVLPVTASEAPMEPNEAIT